MASNSELMYLVTRYTVLKEMIELKGEDIDMNSSEVKEYNMIVSILKEIKKNMGGGCEGGCCGGHHH